MSIIQSAFRLLDKRLVFQLSRNISINAADISENKVESLPKKCKVVICGGGVQGAAVAYHLAKLGWGGDTVLLEQGRWDN